jgi:uncharacterized protein YifN (PemK superfamily)
MCDFDRGGFLPPEMVKRRRVVILRAFTRTAVVVPLSATQPRQSRSYHAAIDPSQYSTITAPVWAIADAIVHVGFKRLSPVTRGMNHVERLTSDDFNRVLIAVAHATGTITLDCSSTVGYIGRVPRERGLLGSGTLEPCDEGRRRPPFFLYSRPSRPRKNARCSSSGVKVRRVRKLRPAVHAPQRRDGIRFVCSCAPRLPLTQRGFGDRMGSTPLPYVPEVTYGPYQRGAHHQRRRGRA